MSTEVRLRRGTTAQHSAFTGALAEVTVDTEKKTVVVHDGATAGGFSIDVTKDAVKAVADRTALKAVDTGAHTVVYLRESGREGQFVWNSSDLSTFVTADTVEGVYVAPTSDATGASGAWVRQNEGVLRPEWFGAVPETNFTTPATDSTTALAGLAAVMNLLPFKTVLSGIYRSTAALVFTGAAVCIEGSDASDHGFLFSGCNGLEITQSSIYDMVQLKRMVLITEDENLYVGVKYRGAPATGLQAIKTYEEVWTIGLDSYGIRRFGETGNSVHGWLKDYDIDDGDRTYLVRCSTEGPGSDALNISFFPLSTRFVAANNCTHLVLINCHCYFKETAVAVTGQAENLEILDGAYVANRKGVTLSGLTNPANDQNIKGAHFASFDYNIDICSDGLLAPLMVNIESCLLFTRGAAAPFGPVADGFTHIKLNAERALVRGNYFYTSGDVDAVAGSHIAVDVISGSNNLIINNTAERANLVVNVRAGATNTLIGGNVTEDNATTLAAVPVADAGTNTMYSPNFGDRVELWPAAIKMSGTQKLWGLAGTQLLVGAGGGVGFSVTNVAGTPVNYVDLIPAVAGGAPVFRALGTDTNINLVLSPKGSGVVQSARPIQGLQFQVAGVKVLGAQGAAVADATDAASVITQLNALLARCRAHGIIAT